MKKIFFLLLSVMIIMEGYGQIQSPNEFLPHNIGEHFTPHHLLVDYYQYVAQACDKVQLVQYGQSNELRPLIAAFVSSPENIARLDEISKNNLIRTGMLEGELKDENIGIVWLSYSVHGNEAAGSESSMPVLYELASGKNTKANEWLENTIVILDPALNPDGYSRYTHWYNRVRMNHLEALSTGLEHNEPWPGGRVNHYYFDLNRDWVWQTQVESHARLKLYQQWMPHVHADLHEMGRNSPYYFAPASQPYHPFITDWQVEFQDKIGRNHARYFDDNGWRYFTKEVFDLLYPSYGDTYPTFNGGIGMTYEQGGSGSAGRGVVITGGDTLTLNDRIAHHLTTSLSTIEMTSTQCKELIENFTSFFNNAQNNPPGEYKTFVIKATNPSGKNEKLKKVLDSHGIRYGISTARKGLKGFSYLSGHQATFDIDANDLVISAFQPKGVLLQVLFEPEPEIVDSLTYDITAWAIPFAHGLTAYATKERLNVTDEPSSMLAEVNAEVENPVGYALKWEDFSSARSLAKLLQYELQPRKTTVPFELDGKTYKEGTVLFLRADHRKRQNFNDWIEELATREGVNLIPLSTGYVDSGKDLGSSSYPFTRVPKAITISGDGVRSNSLGQIWYFFEQEINYPLTIVDVDDLNSVPWDDYNVLILPEGFYRLNGAMGDLKEWMRSGGRIVSIGSSVTNFRSEDGFKLKTYAEMDSKSKEDTERKRDQLDNRLQPYNERRRSSVVNNVPGAIFKTNVDSTHPLGYGLGDVYWTLKTSSRHYEHLAGADNVVYIKNAEHHFGFAGSKAVEKLENTIVISSERQGRGSIVYMIDNPLFRSFWEQGKMLFSNALFF